MLISHNNIKAQAMHSYRTDKKVLPCDYAFWTIKQFKIIGKLKLLKAKS
jgi:hypothetical protein